MARQEAEATVTQTVLDRLTDLDLRTPADPPVGRAQSVRQLKAALRRDLEWLLNTRQTPDPATEALPEARQSLFNYGLPDTSSLSIQSVKDQNRLLWMLESTVAIFEPRLEGIKVNMEPTAPGSRLIRFQIEGLLKMDPAPERVSFDTVLELTSGVYEIKGDAGA